jgi:hypothetical protein
MAKSANEGEIITKSAKPMSKFRQILRWIAVLPAGVVCAFLVTFPIHWGVMLIQYFGKPEENSKTVTYTNPLAMIPPDVLEMFGYALFVPMVLITSGAILAPRFKFRTGIAIAILFLGLCCLLLGNSESIDISGFRYAVTIILWVVGVAWGLYNAYNAHKTLSSEKEQIIKIEEKTEYL